MTASLAVSDPVARPDRLIEALVGLASGTMRLLRHQAIAAGLSMPQGHILLWLAREGPRPTSSWAHRIGTSPSTASELVDGLETLGLVRRVRSEDDRRQVILEITPPGRRLADRIRAGQRTQLRDRLRDMSDAELERTIAALETLTVRLRPDPVREPDGVDGNGTAPLPARRPARRPRPAGHRGAPRRPGPAPRRTDD